MIDTLCATSRIPALFVKALGMGIVAALLAGTFGQPASAQQVTKIEYVSFDTNVVPNTSAGTPVRLRAERPGQRRLPTASRRNHPFEQRRAG